MPKSVRVSLGLALISLLVFAAGTLARKKKQEDDRLKTIRKALVDKPRVSRTAARKQRFAEALGRLLTEVP